eukprot:TRINITY_DN1152_c0_g2_i8.p2 TRINITY_DN1152_c0_g2~~TRINITY_DN1152_c0_g2_i8.p2  ORF type:complete len:261 (-),score=70.07 TRINITY_DN1152_c0_g2_i8:242-1024(-)
MEREAAHASEAHAETDAEQELRRLRAELEEVRAQKTRLRTHAPEVAPSKGDTYARYSGAVEGDGGRGCTSGAHDRPEEAADFDMNRKQLEFDDLRSRVDELRTRVPSSSTTSGSGRADLERLRAEVAALRAAKHAQLEAQAKADAQREREEVAELRAEVEALRARREREEMERMRAQAEAEAKARVEAEAEAARQREEVERLRAEVAAFRDGAVHANTPIAQGGVGGDGDIARAIGGHSDVQGAHDASRYGGCVGDGAEG